MLKISDHLFDKPYVNCPKVRGTILEKRSSLFKWVTAKQYNYEIKASFPNNLYIVHEMYTKDWWDFVHNFSQFQNIAF